jgi:uncharacterized protein
MSTHGHRMRRLLLVLITILVVLLGGSIFLGTLKTPQTSKKVVLNTHDRQLQVLALRTDPKLRGALQLLGEDHILQSAADDYRAESQTLAKDPRRRIPILLKLGLLETETAPDLVLKTWKEANANPAAPILEGLWRSPPQILPNSEAILGEQLTGWYRSQALTKLFTAQRRTDALQELQADDRALAMELFSRLLVVQLVPQIATVLGSLLFVGWLVWRQFQPLPPRWQVPWSLETTWEGIVFWYALFLCLGNLLFQLESNLKFFKSDALGIALSNLFNYGVLSGVGLLLLYVLIWRPVSGSRKEFSYQFVPGWWRWGIGGWLVCFPVVLVFATLSQQLLGDGGGGNSLLESIGNATSPLVQLVFISALSIAAPLFEETFFRGFVFAGLASRLSTLQAIVASAMLFALAHWSAVEFLPLAALGIILATVYHYTRSLLPSILIHALWNGGTFLFLILLGNG